MFLNFLNNSGEPVVLFHIDNIVRMQPVSDGVQIQATDGQTYNLKGASFQAVIEELSGKGRTIAIGRKPELVIVNPNWKPAEPAAFEDQMVLYRKPAEPAV